MKKPFLELMSKSCLVLSPHHTCGKTKSGRVWPLTNTNKQRTRENLDKNKCGKWKSGQEWVWQTGQLVAPPCHWRWGHDGMQAGWKDGRFADTSVLSPWLLMQDNMPSRHPIPIVLISHHVDILSLNISRSQESIESESVSFKYFLILICVTQPV